MGLITRADRALFTAYCETWARYVQAVKQVEKEGLTAVTDKGNVIQHPAVGVANKQKAELRRLAQEFGLSPSSRTRIEVPKQEDQVSGKAQVLPDRGISSRRLTSIPGRSETTIDSMRWPRTRPATFSRNV